MWKQNIFNKVHDLSKTSDTLRNIDFWNVAL